MSTFVVFETMYGCSRDVAQAIVAGYASGDACAVEVTEFVEGPRRGVLPDDVTLLVVGGPTHAFSMSRPDTRRDAAKYGATISGTGVREWLATLTLPAGLPVAAFGTKLDSPLSGSSAHAIARHLHRLGGTLVLPAASFHVTGTRQALVHGEIDRAQAWGAALAAHAPAAA